MRVAVVGAGIVGVLTAYFLAKRGHDVTVFEKNSSAAMECSHANGGQMSVSNAETWNTWKNVKKGISWMFQKDAPLLVHPTLSPSQLRWIAGFLRHTLNGTHIPNTTKTIILGLESRDLYNEIISAEGIKFDQKKSGILHVYTNDDSFDDAASLQRFFESHELEWTPVSSQEIKKLDPRIDTFRDLVGGIYTPSDWTGDAHLFCKELLKVCQKKYKVKAKFGFEVKDFNRNIVFAESEIMKVDLSFDKIIFCNGHEIMNFSKELHDGLNIYPVKGYSITIDGADSAPDVSILDDDKKIVSSKLGTRLRVAGTAEIGKPNLDIKRDRVNPLLKWVNTNFPSVDTSNYSSWACLRPMNSNMMPIYKQSRTDENVYYHGGHGHLGWTLAPATAKRLIETYGF